VAPEGGITVSGVYVPGGTCVGGNAYVVNRSAETFGADVEAWRPERWLGAGEGEGRRKMAAGMLTVRDGLLVSLCAVVGGEADVRQFGAGRRVCMGKPIAMMEMKKLVAFLVLNYKVSRACMPWSISRGIPFPPIL
jgi:cytochrome P450